MVHGLGAEDRVVVLILAHDSGLEHLAETREWSGSRFGFETPTGHTLLEWSGSLFRFGTPTADT